jgi:hypothetical protein
VPAAANLQSLTVASPSGGDNNGKLVVTITPGERRSRDTRYNITIERADDVDATTYSPNGTQQLFGERIDHIAYFVF